MITLDTLRAAALSPQPWTELDKLVRAELAAGRLTRAVYDEIMALQETVRDTPGYTEDADDAIGDTLDALIGFCRSDCAYKNPPILPSEEEIAKLPHWARVAFAARCARRVLPVGKLIAEPNPKTDYTTEGVWIAEAETAASDATPVPQRTLSITQNPVVLAAGHALFTAMGDATTLVTRTVEMFAQLDDKFPSSRVRVRRDFDHLAKLAEWQKWTDDTPVPPEVFGPLWPEGSPKGWPPITDVAPRTELALEAFARERATEQMIEDDVVNLFNALNRYHIARSGVRLTLEQFRSLVPSLVPAEV